MRKVISLLLAASLLGVLANVSLAGGAKPAKVFTDASGDADVGQGLGASIPAGFDLTQGTIGVKGKNVEFTVTHADMPPSGSLPEGARFLWNFTVNKKPFRLTVKSGDIGKPDVVGGQTTERVGRVDLQGHFRLEGECVTQQALPNLQTVNCPPIGYFGGSFNPATKSFTAIIPMKALKAKPGSVIGPGPENICFICWVSHTAERSLNNTLIDTANQTKSFKLPR